jgi:hypothetical protein
LIRFAHEEEKNYRLANKDWRSKANKDWRLAEKDYRLTLLEFRLKTCEMLGKQMLVVSRHRLLSCAEDSTYDNRLATNWTIDKEAKKVANKQKLSISVTICYQIIKYGRKDFKI